MKKLFCFLLCLGVLVAPTILHAQSNKLRVAVYTTNKIEATSRQVINSRAIANLVRSEKYIALERADAFLNAILKEQDYQLSGDVTDDQIVKLGAKHGANYVAVFDASKSEDGYCLMLARLINVETGEVVKSSSSDRIIESTKDLVALTNNVAYRLFVQTE